MIVKMKFLSITGPKADIDRVVDEYLSKYEFHLENALSELKTVQDLRPYIEINPYKSLLIKANEYISLIDVGNVKTSRSISLEEAIEVINNLEHTLGRLKEELSSLEDKRSALNASLSKIEPFRELQYDLRSILHFRFIKYRFGKISHEYYEKFEKYVYANLDTIFYKCHCDEDYVWGVYFVPERLNKKIDAVYSSLHFERIFLPDDYEGTPEEAYNSIGGQINALTVQINDVNQKLTAELDDSKEMLYLAQDRLNALSSNFDVRKLAACTKENQIMFYILCAWMTENDARQFARDIENDSNLYCIVEDDHNNIFSRPPTKLKNPKIFKPFEMFIKMYGLPAYNEIDPTIFVALTYAFIFGIMFGDVGQGICLVVGGFLLYRLKGLDLGAIIGTAGIFSTFFGFMFGSFFGFEDKIEAVWLRPISHMTNVPFIGNLNTVFIVAIAFGMFLIIITMIMHVINGMKAHDVENAYFDTNGIAGLVFYGSAVGVVTLFMTGNTLPAGIVLIVMFGIPLLVMAFKEPVSRLIEKKADVMPGGKGMFVVQACFEMFEVLLSYFSNTLSFVRIGAFAVSHAAMMEVVLMLAGAENGGAPNWIIIILGNLFVCGMEGLIVGIQVLRLEYYEMFSRFYKGTGREFKPYAKARPKNKTV